MAHSTKIATCCYCGTRAALTLIGRERHELACSNCGAPLREMKMLKVQAPVRARKEQSYHRKSNAKPVRRHRKKRSRSLSQRFLSDFWDAVEDVFDDVFDDLFD